MPKLIADLDERIRAAAYRLFSERGYEGVDMRSIAGTVEVAVGTLYNYYPDKLVLFQKVMREMYERFVKEVESCRPEGETGPNYVLERIYGFINAHAGLFDGSKSEPNHAELIKGAVDLLARTLSNECPNETYRRISVALIYSMTAMVKRYPETKKENVDFIIWMVESLGKNMPDARG